MIRLTHRTFRNVMPDKVALKGLSRVRGNLHARFLGECTAGNVVPLPDNSVQTDVETSDSQVPDGHDQKMIVCVSCWLY